MRPDADGLLGYRIALAEWREARARRRLLRRARAGDPRAAGQLWDRYRVRVHSAGEVAAENARRRGRAGGGC
jgi:hypothetical protein